MYARSIAALASLAVIAIIVLSACDADRSGADLSAVIAEGILVPPDFEAAAGSFLEPQLVTVTRGDFTRSVNTPVTVEFAMSHNLSFEHSGGWYRGPMVGYRAMVEAGDVLAAKYFYISELMVVERYRLILEIEQFEAGYTAQRTERLQTIRETRTAMNAAAGNEREALRLQLRRLEVQLEQFTANAQETRQNYQEQLEDMYRYTERIYAPFDGIIVWSMLIRDITQVTAGVPVLAIAEADTLVFHVTSMADIIRHGNILTIRAEDISFDAVVVADTLVGGRTQFIRFTLQPLDIEALFTTLENLGLTLLDLSDMEPVVEINEVLIHNALKLPADAIRQEDLVEYVLIYNEGRIMKRFVSTGFALHNYVQVLMGVEEGQMVVMP